MMKFISSKKKTNNYLYWKYTPHRKQSRKGTEDSFTKTLQGHPQKTISNKNKEVTKTKIYSETPLNRNSHHIEGKQLIRHASTQYKPLPKSISEQN